MRSDDRRPAALRRLGPDVAGQGPGEAREDVGPREFRRRQADREGKRHAPVVRRGEHPRRAERRAPEQREATRQEDEREGRHPAVAGDVDKEGLDDPEERDGEIAKARRPTCRHRGADVRRGQKRQAGQREAQKRQRHEREGHLPQPRKHTRAKGQRKPPPTRQRPDPFGPPAPDRRR